MSQGKNIGLYRNAYEQVTNVVTCNDFIGGRVVKAERTLPENRFVSFGRAAVRAREAIGGFSGVYGGVR